MRCGFPIEEALHTLQVLSNKKLLSLLSWLGAGGKVINTDEDRVVNLHPSIQKGLFPAQHMQTACTPKCIRYCCVKITQTSMVKSFKENSELGMPKRTETSY